MLDVAARLALALEGRYRLDQVVGRGGMSVVYRALDLRHERSVAIKVFTETVGHGGAERFLREIGFLARLHHPHILPLLDSGTAEGLLYYVMPFVEGESLRERMSREPRMATQEALRLLTEVCDALRYAHGQGIVHRDIKPENVLLVDRHAVVADFGVARAVHKGDTTSSATSAGLAVGTPTYMSPEQAAADPHVDHRADLYALGIVAYEILAGRPPFVAESPHLVLAAHVTQAPADLASLRPDLPPELARVIMRCLAKRADERWPDAGALREALEPFILPSGAMTPVAMPPYVRRRRRLQAFAGIGGAALIIALALWLAPTNGPALQLGEPRRLGLATDLELDPAISPDGRMIAYATGQLGALRIRVRQLAGGEAVTVAPDVAGSQRWPRWSPDGTSLSFQAAGTVYQVPPLGGAVRPLVEGHDAEPAGDFSWSPDGSRQAYTRAGAIHVRGTAGGDPVELVRDATAHSLAWSPDGRWIAYVSGNREFVFDETLFANIAPSTLMLVASTGGTPIALTDGRSLAASPAWHDNESLVHIAGGGATRDAFAVRIGRRGRPAGNPERLTTGLRLHSIARDPESGGLVYVLLDHVANVWAVPLPAPGGPAASIRDAVPVTEGDQVVEDMDVLPGGGWLVFDSNRGGSQDIWLQGGVASAPIPLTSDPGDEFGPAWSPNGREVAYYAVREGIRHLFVMRATGQGVVQVTADSLQDQQPKWSPDGQSLVFYRRDGAGRDRLFVTTRGTDSTWSTPRPLGDELGTASAWSSDGRWIAFTDPEGNLRTRDAAGGPSRIVARPADVGGLPIRRPHWLWAEPAMLARVEGPGGTGGIWRFSVAGEVPRELVRLDDPTRPVHRADLTADSERVYLLVSEFSGSVWRIPVGTTP